MYADVALLTESTNIDGIFVKNGQLRMFIVKNRYEHMSPDLSTHCLAKSHASRHRLKAALSAKGLAKSAAFLLDHSQPKQILMRILTVTSSDMTERRM